LKSLTKSQTFIPDSPELRHIGAE